MDRNYTKARKSQRSGASLSARRAWIEIPALLSNSQNEGVALRKESVDRNIFYYGGAQNGCVALRKESVDRNKHPKPSEKIQMVALRKESVDRNMGQALNHLVFVSRSPQGERG